MFFLSGFRIVKKAFVLIFPAVLTILLFAGCTAVSEPAELLYYQKYPAGVKLTLKNEDDSYSFYVFLGARSGEDLQSASEFGRTGAEITVAYPENISGVKYIFEPSGTYISSGDLKIPVSRSVVKGLYPLLRGFCVDVGNLVLTNTDTSGGVPLTSAEFRTDDGKLTIYLNDEGLPVRMIFDGTVNFTVEIEEFAILQE